MLYNLACYESLAGRSDAALSDLRRSIELDPSFRELARGDADFDPIRARSQSSSSRNLVPATGLCLYGAVSAKPSSS